MIRGVAAAVQSGERSATAVVSVALAAIAAGNEAINAFTHVAEERGPEAAAVAAAISHVLMTDASRC